MVTNTVKRNLWGDLGDLGTFRTPANILREQARMLGELTNNVLMGDVKVSKIGGDYFENVLRIIVPPLGNYSYDMLRVVYPPKLYPLKIWDGVNDRRHNCIDEDAFILKLEEILQSDSVRNVIKLLLSQCEE